MNKIKVLILEDSNNPISKITDTLKEYNFSLDVCNNNNDFFDYIYNNLYDLYVVQVNENLFPRFELIKLLDDYKNITLKITIVPNSDDMIKTSFFYGCDECFVNTIDEKEMHLRIKALVRRQFNVYTDSIYLKENIEYEIFNKRVLIDKKEFKLGKTSILILNHLLKFRNTFISSKDLESGMYPANTSCKNGVIRFHIHKIRKILGTELIISNKSNGYKLVLDITSKI